MLFIASLKVDDKWETWIYSLWKNTVYKPVEKLHLPYYYPSCDPRGPEQQTHINKVMVFYSFNYRFTVSIPHLFIIVYIYFHYIL